MPDSTPLDPLANARAQAVRRILELRGEPAGDDSLDVRTVLSRVDARAGEFNAAARELSAVLPTRVEAAIGRVLADDAGGVGRRLDAVHAGTEEIAETVARVERDLLAERLGRIEDLEALVGLVSSGIAAIRGDVSRLNQRIDELAGRLDQLGAPPAQAPEAPAAEQASGGRRAYRSLFARTEPGAQRDTEATAERSA
jgi:hypothetical protein